MASITQLPRGLVSLTGLRDMGEAPRELSEIIAPSIDVTQFLLLNRETIFENFIISAVATVASPTIPPGELWYIHQWSVDADVNATNAISLCVGFFQGNRFFAAGVPSPIRSGTGDLVSAYMDGPKWLGPGVSLAFQVQHWAGPATNLRAQLSISRLRI